MIRGPTGPCIQSKIQGMRVITKPQTSSMAPKKKGAIRKNAPGDNQRNKKDKK